MRTRLLIVAALAALAAPGAAVWAQQRLPTVTEPSAVGQTRGTISDPFGTFDPEQLDERRRKLLEALPSNLATRDTTFEDLVADWTSAKPFPRETVVFIDEHFAYPHIAFPWKMEVVKDEGETIWLRGLSPEDPESFLHELWKQVEGNQLTVQDLARMAEDAYFLDFAQPVATPVSVDRLTFEPAGRGLPDRGRWQMGFDMADVNSDGRPDLILPPPRKGRPQPTVLLGREKATFEFWPAARWASDVPFDYGDVTTADFDQDGKLDLALAIHFKPQYVLYGDGRGGFTRSKKLPCPDPRLSSRAVGTGDFNQDGRPDLVFLAEVDYDLATNRKLSSPTLWVLLNDGNGGWRVDTEGMPTNLIGDNLVVTDMDGDGREDVVLAANRGGWRALVYLNREGGWQPSKPTHVLSNAYHFDAVPIRGPHGEIMGFVTAFEQFRSHQGENQARTGLIVYPWKDDGVLARNRPVVFDDQRSNPYFRLAVGDVSGDGLDDIVASRKSGGLEVYLQTDDGRFFQERSPEIGPTARAYDLRLVDLDGDGSDDIVAMFADLEERAGGVRVWLSRPGS